MAKQLGITAGTVKNLLSSLSKRGWISVEVEGNKRIAITPLLGLSVKEKGSKKSVTQELRSVENSTESVTQELRYRNSTMTVPSSRNDDLNRGVTGEGIINNKEYNKKEINKEKSSAGLAGSGPASRLNIRREDYADDYDYEKEFYKRNTIYLGAN